ncbi:hypothetical protein KQX54_017435 [Cotesia glomerata]|uniref:Uncharacterized protein n=1 Tax=Cotesia glomerata TaxID=32391 RepID=A0AAV7IZX5_COTGL|nr:hypothetical protein KQX54_017435 [Cotesia glomerata]
MKFAKNCSSAIALTRCIYPVAIGAVKPFSSTTTIQHLPAHYCSVAIAIAFTLDVHINAIVYGECASRFYSIRFEAVQRFVNFSPLLAILSFNFQILGFYEEEYSSHSVQENTRQKRVERATTNGDLNSIQSIFLTPRTSWRFTGLGRGLGADVA